MSTSSSAKTLKSLETEVDEADRRTMKYASEREVHGPKAENPDSPDDIVCGMCAFGYPESCIYWSFMQLNYGTEKEDQDD